jgi:hypothetical protein
MFTAQLVGPTDEPPGMNAACARRGRDTATWKRVCDERCTCAGHAAGVASLDPSELRKAAHRAEAFRRAGVC